MTLPVVLWVAGSVFVAAMVQQLSGFGFALLAVPLLSVVIGPKEAVAVTTGAGLASSAVMAWTLRARIERLELGRMLIGAAIGLPIGVVILRQASDDPLRLALGVLLLVTVGFLARGATLGSHRPGVQVGAGVLSGVLNGSLGTGGPPVVVLLQAADTEQHRFRATTSAFFAVCDLVLIPMIVLSGAVRPEAWAYSVTSLPAVALAATIGAPLALRVNPDAFRRLVLGLLVITAVVTIALALR